jgi:NAD(P)-dependent dehydrogenase (short-subunit alcohol dehydrogenase family)
LFALLEYAMNDLAYYLEIAIVVTGPSGIPLAADLRALETTLVLDGQTKGSNMVRAVLLRVVRGLTMPELPLAARNAPRKRSVVVTGASSGIGRATVLRLTRNGWRVFAAVREDADARSIEDEAKGDLETIQLDLVDPDSIHTAAQDVDRRLNGLGLNGLFNNAGTGLTAPVEHIPLDDLRRVFEVNVFGQVAMIQAFLPLVRRARGRIVNTGSVGDHVTPPFGAAIASPKAALASISMALRLELRSQGIHVILIEPGSINTEAVEKILGAIDEMSLALPSDGQELMATQCGRWQPPAKSERAGSPPEVVAEIVERALNDRRPQTRYAAGKDAVKLTLAARFLPEKLFDRAILKTFGLSTAFGPPR